MTEVKKRFAHVSQIELARMHHYLSTMENNTTFQTMKQRTKSRHCIPSNENSAHIHLHPVAHATIASMKGLCESCERLGQKKNAIRLRRPLERLE